jgi:hypothetical protein
MTSTSIVVPNPKASQYEVPKRAAQQSPGFVRPTASGIELVETVVDAKGRLQFVTNKQEGRFNEWVSGDETFVPLDCLKPFWKAGALKLPSQAIRGITSRELVAQINAFIPRYVSLPDEWLNPIAHYVLLTWAFDRFRAVPYLRFLGEAESGKTRLLDVCNSLCYRSFSANGNITGAALFRSLHLIRGTFAVDEADFKNSSDWSEITKIFNGGYAHGNPVIRCNQGKDFEPECFETYGPKIITSRRRFDDNATETRCLTFEVQDRKIPAHVPLQLPPAFDREAEELRNRLLGWRFDNFERIAVDESQLRDLNPRMAQVGMSLLAVASDDEARAGLSAFLGNYSEETRGSSLKALVARILKDCGAPEIRVQVVTEMVNQHLEGSDVDALNTKAAGSLIRSLGYNTRRTRDGYVVMLGRA